MIVSDLARSRGRLFTRIMTHCFRVRRHGREGGLQFQSYAFHGRGIGMAIDPDRGSPQKGPARKRIRNYKAIPAEKDFFFEQANVRGTTGMPVILARATTPGCTLCLGPLGPSGVTTRSTPCRPERMSRRKAPWPPRVVDPRTAPNPNRFTIW